MFYRQQLPWTATKKALKIDSVTFFCHSRATDYETDSQDDYNQVDITKSKLEQNQKDRKIPSS